MRDHIILLIIALAMIVGVIEAMKVGRGVQNNQSVILENQKLLKETLKLHDQNKPTQSNEKSN